MKIDLKNRFKKIKIVPRLAIVYSIIPLLIFSIIAFVIFINQKNKIYGELESQMTKNLKNLIVSVKIDRNKIIEQNNIALSTFRSFVSSNKSFFSFNQNNININVINNISGIQEEASINNWKFRGDTILQNSKFIIALSLALKSDLIIAQKTKTGYVNLSSTNPSFDLLLFPYSSEIVYTVEKGEIYRGNSIINGKDYFVRAAPLYINGKISGMLMSIVKNKFSLELSNMFGEQVYLQRGYPFAMDLDGNILIHPTLIGQNISYTDLYGRILKAQEMNTYLYFDYIWPETLNGETKFLMIQYIPEIQTFIAITFYESDIKAMIGHLRISLIMAVILSSLTIVLSVIFVSNFFLKRIKSISENLLKLSIGVIPKDIKTISEGELFQIVEAENRLINNFNQLKQFTEHLKNKDFSFNYKKWSDSDKIGDNLLELNHYLLETEKDSIEKTKVQERIVWLNEGISKFIEILKYQVIEIKDLAYRIISQIVEYVDANEGGFFIISKEKDEKYIELLAAYAMQIRKVFDRKIPFGVGLIGRVAIEKKTLFLTEIPDSYSKISTSLGQGKPSSIVVLPLIYNDEVIGIIEIASFKVFTKLQLEFLDKISENVASNLAMWQASRQTARLLKESRQQQEQQELQQKELKSHLKELEKLRDESEQREIELNSMIKAVDTTALLIEYDTNGKISSVNRRFLETLEREETEMIGKLHRDITSMDTYSDEYKLFWADLLEGKTKRFLESFNIKEKVIWLSQNYVPILNKEGVVFKILNIAIDVTENKTLEKQLRSQVREISKEARTVRKEQRKIRKEREQHENKTQTFNAVIRGIKDYLGYVEFSIDGTILTMNEKFGQILNYDIKLLENKNIKDFVSDKDIEIFKLALEKNISGEEYSSEVYLLNSTSENIKVIYSLIPTFNFKNKVEKIIMIIKK